MFPVSRDKYNEIVAKHDELLDRYANLEKKLEEANIFLAAETIRANDFALEVQRLTTPESNQQTIESLAFELSEANTMVKTNQENLTIKIAELEQATKRIEELEQSIKILKNIAVGDSSTAITENDSIVDDPLSVVKYFQDNAEDTDACITKLRELGL